MLACAVGAVAALSWSHGKDLDQKVRMREKDVQTLAEKISQ